MAKESGVGPVNTCTGSFSFFSRCPAGLEPMQDKGHTMPRLTEFSLPANQQDFRPGSPGDVALKKQWNTNITGFTLQAILGNPWTSIGAANQTEYFDSLTTDIPDGSTAALIDWIAFPHRLQQYQQAGQNPPNPYNLSEEEILELADTGGAEGTRISFKEIPTGDNLCPQVNWDGTKQMYGPYGPRGWLDEYCEWSVVRNADNKITRIDFTCENPEYWNSLWMVSPERVADLYEVTLNFDAPDEDLIKVQLSDLYVYKPNSTQPVIDPSTGRPLYNPLNKWNSGTVSVRGAGRGNTGGAMHLTSTPNTLQTEMGLASGASVQRKMGNNSPQQLICCSQYGQAYRNSDPHIGLLTNQVVSLGNRVALADPTGLYIQKPVLDVKNGGNYQLPADPNLPKDATVDDCWQIIRGHQTLIDPVTGLPYGLATPGGTGGGNFILHAVFQLPKAWIKAGVKFTIGDIYRIDEPEVTIKWGGQIAQNTHIGLWARPIRQTHPTTPLDCVTAKVSPAAQPLQIFHADVWDGYYGTSVVNPMGQEMNLASNSTLIAPILSPGAQNVPMVLTCGSVNSGPKGEPPSVSVSSGDVVVTDVKLSKGTFNYAVPGNSYPGPVQIVRFNVSVLPMAKEGLRAVHLTNFGEPETNPMPGLLNIKAAGR